LSPTCPLRSTLYHLRRERQHAIDLAQFAPELAPGITPVITAVQIPIAAPSHHGLRVVRLRMHRPHGGVGLYGQMQNPLALLARSPPRTMSRPISRRSIAVALH